MTEVRIPFLSMFQEPLREGRKTVTSRMKRYGRIDDEFESYGMRFRLISEPYKELITTIRDTLYKDEGFETPEAFQATWLRIHPSHARQSQGIIFLEPATMAWVHRFKRADANLEKSE